MEVSERPVTETNGGGEDEQLLHARQPFPGEDEQLLHARVVELINDRLGDTLDASLLSLYREDLIEKLARVESRLNEVQATANYELADAEHSREKLANKVVDIIGQQDELLVNASDAANECRNFAADNRELLEDINCVRGVTQYAVWLQLIEEISLDMSVSLETTDRDQVVSCYGKLKEISVLLDNSKCLHLKQYVERMRAHWFSIIEEKYTASLQAALDAFGWPFVDALDHPSSKTLADVVKAGAGEARSLAEAAETLLRIQEEPGDSSGHHQLSLPMRLLLRPLRRRFKYHFLGSKATNNPAKPEWFTTQLSTWALSHRHFLEQHIQPVYDRVGVQLPVRMEFAQGLVGLACEKLNVDIPIVVVDDVLLAHTIDETIGFARDIANHMQYSATQPSVLQPLTQPGVFSRWLNMERKFAFEKVDTLFMGEPGNSVWESEIADSLTPRAAESFLALLLSVTERYKFLSATHHRLEFLQLQIDLIEDFRVRLVQLSRSEMENPLSSNLCPILNTVDHLILVLGNWAETPFFLQLQFQLDNSEDMSMTVFQAKTEELTYFKQEMITEIVHSIFYAVKARSLKYRTETRWFNIGETSGTVSPTFCDMLQTLAFSLETARKRLVESAFQRLWQDLAQRLDSFMLENLVLCNKFSLEGVKQLEIDMRAGIFPILAEFSPCPPAHFPTIMEVLTLMTKSAGSLILVRDSLLEDKGISSEAARAHILADLGLTCISPTLALRLIKQRVDLDLVDS